MSKALFAAFTLYRLAVSGAIVRFPASALDFQHDRHSRQPFRSAQASHPSHPASEQRHEWSYCEPTRLLERDGAGGGEHAGDPDGVRKTLGGDRADFAVDVVFNAAD